MKLRGAELASGPGLSVLLALVVSAAAEAAALAGGAQGSFFQTDLDLNNAGDAVSTYSLLWLPRGEDDSSPTASETFTLAAGASVRYDNVLSEFFGASPDALGALALSTDDGNVLVMSQTYNVPSVKIAGTFGRALERILADRLLHAGDVGRVIFLSENDDIRSNIGCVNGGAFPITIGIVEYDATGTLLETRTMNLPPWSNEQINRILEDVAPVDGYVDVSSIYSGQRILFGGEDVDERFNITCLSGGDCRSSDVELEIRGADGGLLGTESLHLPPFGSAQFHRVFADYGPVEGYVQVRTDWGTWTYCFGSRIDNFGSRIDNRTDDPTTVLPR